ncbi:MAG: DHA2 family efflux MFS transporter permease subunit [Thiohalocapsa sp.]|uniref:DHA2 family efflux MFS transporter permease subunit n=1 Tax=Thiohalocapsa sp. TaxID=2497641 RepID=UPI0025D72E43|nr:DHA2 family efflux MFS transporter permease subunit [Thiohalocapsa sp.]MCG6941523.1 DHA2 family efflux MFS transporter permease subunit [Thiohalocapsa sp.]
MSNADTNAVAAPPPLPPGTQRTMLLLTALMVSVMAAVDMTIVSVALPYMAGNLGAGPDQITWVVTMFTCGQALVIGFTGHLSRLLGRRRLAIIVVVGFVASSIGCGLSQSLTEIVIFRFIQGVFSGPLIPLSQSILVDAYPAEERPKALSIWAVGVLGGPALGPIVGGYLAQDLDWRWNFWVNLPIGVVAVLLILRFVRAVPSQRVRTDLVGLVLLAIWVISLQVMLDQGDTMDWFGAVEIWVLAILAFTFALAFIARGIVVGDANIMRLRLFADTNFLACSLLVALLGSIFLGSLIMTPELLIDDYQWEVVTAGLVMGAAGACGVVGSLVGGRIVGFFGIRLMVLVGAGLMAVGWLRYSGLNPDAGPVDVFVPSAIIMFGLFLIFPLLAAQAFRNLRPDERDEGAGLFNFVKTLGFSFGVTFVGTMIYRGNLGNWTRYVGDVSPGNPAFEQFLHGPPLSGNLDLTAAVVADELARQSHILAITQLAEILAVLALLAMPLALLLQPQPKTA